MVDEDSRHSDRDAIGGIHEQSDVFVLTADDGSALILKVHQQLAAAKRELMAYRMLSGVGFQSVPQLVDVWSEDARFLLLEKMPGTPAMIGLVQALPNGRVGCSISSIKCPTEI